MVDIRLLEEHLAHHTHIHRTNPWSGPVAAAAQKQLIDQETGLERYLRFPITALLLWKKIRHTSGPDEMLPSEADLKERVFAFIASIEDRTANDVREEYAALTSAIEQAYRKEEEAVETAWRFVSPHKTTAYRRSQQVKR